MPVHPRNLSIVVNRRPQCRHSRLRRTSPPGAGRDSMVRCHLHPHPRHSIPTPGWPRSGSGAGAGAGTGCGAFRGISGGPPQCAEQEFRCLLFPSYPNASETVRTSGNVDIEYWFAENDASRETNTAWSRILAQAGLSFRIGGSSGPCRGRVRTLQAASPLEEPSPSRNPPCALSGLHLREAHLLTNRRGRVHSRIFPIQKDLALLRQAVPRRALP